MGSQERALSKEEYDAVRALPGPKRYEYFVKRAADSGVIWGLVKGEKWAAAATSDGRRVLPFWSAPEFARDCAHGEWDGNEPSSIPLSDFLAVWIPGMERDGILPSVFMGADGRGVVVEPRRLKEDLEAELKWY